MTEDPSIDNQGPAEFFGTPLGRIIEVAENGVNSEILQAVTLELTRLSSDIEEITRPFLRENRGDRETFNAATIEAEDGQAAILEDQIQYLLRLLDDPIQVIDKARGETYNFAFGQGIKYTQLRELYDLILQSRASLMNDPKEQRWDAMKGTGSVMETWASDCVPPIFDELRSRVLDNPRFDVELTSFLRDEIANAQMRNLDRLEKSAEETLRHIDTAAGKIGSVSLAKAFADQRDREGRRARWWTLGVILLVLLGLSMPAFVFTYDQILFTTVEGTTGIVVKALFSVPLFALAAYFGRTSSQHRETERYLRILVAQLDSVQAYADQMAIPHRQELVTFLGKRVFGNPEFARQGTGKNSQMHDDVLALLNRVVELAKDSVQKP